MNIKTKKGKLIWSLLLLTMLVLLSFLYLFLNRKYGISIPCVFYEITGFYCPGCGVTRVIFSLLQLDFMQAIYYNVLIVVLIPIFLFVYGIRYYEWFTGRKVLSIPNWFWWSIVVVTLLFGILRNLEMFDFLEPTYLS